MCLWTIPLLLVSLLAVVGWLAALVRLWAAEIARHPSARGARVIIALLWVAYCGWLVMSSIYMGFGPQSWSHYWTDAWQSSSSERIVSVLLGFSLLAGLSGTLLSLVSARHVAYR
jgi:hypothetical protein